MEGGREVPFDIRADQYQGGSNKYFAGSRIEWTFEDVQIKVGGGGWHWLGWQGPLCLAFILAGSQRHCTTLPNVERQGALEVKF